MQGLRGCQELRFAAPSLKQHCSGLALHDATASMGASARAALALEPGGEGGSSPCCSGWEMQGRDVRKPSDQQHCPPHHRLLL